MIVAGIDEAGYGPMLGPLVVACAWGEDVGARSLRRFGVRDSKLFPPRGRLGALARLAIPALGHPRALALPEAPWYAGGEPLPEVPPLPWRVRAAFEIVEPSAINAGALKSDVLFDATARLMRGDRVFADAQGSRRSYAPLLRRHFRDVRVLSEGRGCSRYRVGGMWLQFRVKGESAHDLTALASIVAKYVRELCMERVAAYWRRRRGLELPLWSASGYHNAPTRDFAREIILPALAGESVDAVIRRK